MDLILKAKGKLGRVENFTIGENKAKFVSLVEKAFLQTRDTFTTQDSDRIVYLFSKGATVIKKDFPILLRSLRHYDAVYLCNELHDKIEELENVKMITLSDEFSSPYDFSKLEV